MKAMTLMETMIALAVILIGMEGFTLLFLRSWDTNKFILEEGLASAAASRATNNVVSELRHARQADNGDYPVESADDFDLKAYLDIDKDGVTERVHYFLDQATDQMKRGITNPTGTAPVTYPAADDSVTVMTNYVVNESDDPVFSYYNGDYPGDTVNNPLATPASVGQIRLIKVHFLVNIDPVHAPENIAIESFADLRNLNSYGE